jgi:predicted tellurium resistance membrane protein TerC
VSLPGTPLPAIGGLDGGQFIIILAGGIIGLVVIRFAANFFVEILRRKPGLETAAFLIVGWVGVKLAINTLTHPNLAYLPKEFTQTFEWKITFWSILFLIAIVGWFVSKDKSKE